MQASFPPDETSSRLAKHLLSTSAAHFFNLVAMLPYFFGIATLVLATQLGAVAASPKIALVRVKDIYVEQPSTKAAQEKASKAKESLLLDPRAEELREAIESLRQLQKKISDPNQKPTQDEGRLLAREFEKKRMETRALQEDFEKFRATREKEIHGEMVADMRKVLNHIVSTAQTASKQKGYDLVLDSSGATNTSAPFVLYARNAPDLTDEVSEILRKENAARESGNKSTAPNPQP